MEPGDPTVKLVRWPKPVRVSALDAVMLLVFGILINFNGQPRPMLQSVAAALVPGASRAAILWEIRENIVQTRLLAPDRLSD